MPFWEKINWPTHLRKEIKHELKEFLDCQPERSRIEPAGHEPAHRGLCQLPAVCGFLGQRSFGGLAVPPPEWKTDRQRGHTRRRAERTAGGPDRLPAELHRPDRRTGIVEQPGEHIA